MCVVIPSTPWEMDGALFFVCRAIWRGFLAQRVSRASFQTNRKGLGTLIAKSVVEVLRARSRPGAEQTGARVAVRILDPVQRGCSEFVRRARRFLPDSGSPLLRTILGQERSIGFPDFERSGWNRVAAPAQCPAQKRWNEILNSASPVRFRVFLIPTLLTFLVAETAAESVTLAWSANPEPDIAGYRVYYGTVTAPYANSVDVGPTTATITNLENGVTYTFAVTAYNTVGAESAYSQPIAYTVGSSRVIPEAVLHNLSSRAFAQTDENVIIGGFIVDGIVGKKVALRAIGPSLADAGVSEPMADPFLQIVDSGGAVVASNDNWNVPGQELDAFGLAPTDGREAAVVATMQPGAYSAIISGQGASTGVALFELYDLEAGTGRVANISTRGRIEPGDKVMIGGFILGGTTGAQVVLRAIGPSLIANGVADALLDPHLDVYDSNGTLLVSNDNWRADQETAIIETGLSPADDREAAIVSTLAPGAYSGVIQGGTGGSGVALFEVYALNK